ncbi:metallophosphoesterase [Thiohalocapsa marina]|uniref:Metallophosphoesterase n=1 Tax=Thiohalocapsa marina TaxID=424902 RepID=A0A5M8FGW1_9GAMM|nr:metallophosphoesterase [Thiohalocapsa marina]KAA6183170.1 metallophosphoesterase [Thiohalocapsa marina]
MSDRKTGSVPEQAMTAADYASLRQRLGTARLRRRLRAQVWHVAGEAHQEDLLFGLGRLVDIDVLVDRGARLLGIHGWGHRNFRDIRLVENPVRHPRMPAALDGFRLLQLSDLHLDLDPTLLDAIRERIRGLDYDLVVLTGDFRNTTDADHGPSVSHTLALLELFDRPVYGILGNHDFIEIVPPLERAGLRFLLNESVAIEHQGARFYLAGIDDPHFYRTHDLAGVRDAIPEEAFAVLLSHSPEIYRDASDYGFELMLSGHTHGGQICLPGGHALIKVCDVPREILAGAWQYRDLVGYTSVGTGSCGVPLRYFCPPEITLHRFEASDNLHTASSNRAPILGQEQIRQAKQSASS